MSEFEESMLKLHERHIEQKIEMERDIYSKELELLNLKIKAKAWAPAKEKTKYV